MSNLSVEQALSRIESLEQDGNWTAAIAALSALNRDHRDTELERRIAELRIRAFDDVDWPDAKAEWPPKIEDPFPLLAGNASIPEISVDQLSATTLGGGIQHHGSLIVRDLVPQEYIASLRENIDRAMDGRKKGNSGIPIAETAPWYAPPTAMRDHKLGAGRKFVELAGGIWAADCPRAMQEIFDLYEELNLRSILHEYFGEPPCVSVRKWVLRRVGQLDGEADWHQDGSFMGAYVHSCNLWIALSHCGGELETPGIELVPRRFNEIVTTGTDGTHFDWTVGADFVREKFSDTPPVTPEFRPGDAIFFDHFNLHRTSWSPNMKHDRYAIECWFFGPSEFPEKQIPMIF
jgi:hypothetical protein